MAAVALIKILRKYKILYLSLPFNSLVYDVYLHLFIAFVSVVYYVITQKCKHKK